MTDVKEKKMKASIITVFLCLGFPFGSFAAQDHDPRRSTEAQRINAGSAVSSVEQAQAMGDCLRFELSQGVTGRVVYIDHRDNFIIVVSEEGGVYRANGLIDEVRENDRVEFDVDQGRRGLNAVNVKVIG